MAPHIFHRIEFGRISGQAFNQNAAAGGSDVAFDQEAAMNGSSVPKDQDLSGDMRWRCWRNSMTCGLLMLPLWI
jgi:hypothetical protein